MTTQINVIVDNGGLSEKAKRQTQANRWQKLEQDNRQKVEAKGIEQRDAERLIRGIGADGRPLYGTPPAQPLRRDEPAAFRSGVYNMLLPPTDAAFNAQVKSGKGFSFQKIYDSTFSTYGTSDTATFVAGGGYTSGANAIEFIRPNPATGTAYSLGVQGGPGNLAISATDDFTLEAWAVVGYGLAAANTSLQRRLTNEAVSLVDYSFGGTEALRPQLLTLALDHQFGDVRFTSGAGGFLYGTNASLSQPWGSWCHIAAVRTAGDIFFYANGVLQFKRSTSSPTQMPSATLSSTNLGFRIGATQRDRNVPNNAPCRVSRVRFTKRALYTSSFTPP